jgi:hypothetical protein
MLDAGFRSDVCNTIKLSGVQAVFWVFYLSPFASALLALQSNTYPPPNQCENWINIDPSEQVADRVSNQVTQMGSASDGPIAKY